jgi:uncharacterized protein (TIGR00288 family)
MSTVVEGRVAVLVDCDNVPPDILDHALLVAAQFGRVVVRRGYGNSGTLNQRWRDVLVKLAFTPCLQFQYASGKNTADLALALDALEALFDARAETFCLVTSDSDFSYLCRKLRERGASVCIVGESKAPDALRNASDQFFEWQLSTAEPANTSGPSLTGGASAGSRAPSNGTEAARPITKRRPLFVVDAVSMLAGSSSDGEVPLGALGVYLKRTDPAFSPKLYGHSGLLEMLKT